MGQVENTSASPSSIGGATVQRRRIQMEAMTNEEVRFNKQILMEISARKKERDTASYRS